MELEKNGVKGGGLIFVFFLRLIEILTKNIDVFIPKGVIPIFCYLLEQ